MTYKFELPQLKYNYDALEPFIDAKTMEIHHTKHHQTYIDKLNAALESHPELQTRELTDLLSNIDTLPTDLQTAIKNHGGGHLNHSMFWESLTPDKPQISESLTAKLTQAFGSFDDFKKQFTTEALNRFGSGWAWLALNGENKLYILSTPNQDNPLMLKAKPILGLDLWEHAYYLKYQNRRAEYIENWWNIINWNAVENNLNIF
ncbi:MAG: superoxide dismutase [Niabella sp.]|nr:MAG: superoxide dismutase [Niabella sp.]